MKIPILLIISSYFALATICDWSNMFSANINGKNILRSLHEKKMPIDYASITDTVYYHCANPDSKKFTQVYYSDTQIKTKLNINAPIVFVIGGWRSTGNEYWAITLSEEWLKYYQTNVCRVVYTKYSMGNYIDVAMNQIQIVAQLIAMFIKQLKSIYKMPYDRVTLAGHSLGGQISGFIGKHLNSEIGRIFALDPAGPLFTIPIVLPKNERLDKSDAKHVVVIHSCDRLLGVSIDCGHQDFYPNYGTYPQPGCVWPFQQEVYPVDGQMKYSSAYCSHVRSIQYLVEALKPDNKCIGLKCKNELQYIFGMWCSGTEQLSINRTGKPDIIAVSWEEWWTYDGISGPAFWGLINPEWSLCNRGRRQSPVNLEPQRLLFDPNLRPIHIDKHRISGVISNTGHSIIFTVDNETVIQYGTSPQISVNLTGGPLSYKYRFQEIHVHYGLHDQFGSEHSVEGYTFPAEIQLFGYNSQLYSNFSEALNRAQGIVGVSVLLQLGDLSNPELRMLTDQLDKIRYGGDEAPVRRISIRGLLPETDHYMTYEGSTTAPACHETVTWIVLNKPIYITKQQMHALRRLMQGSPDHPKAPLGNNFRPPQQLYHRPVRTNIDFRGKQNGKICPTMYRDVHYKANSWKQH